MDFWSINSMFPLLSSSNQATWGKENHTTIPTALQGFHFVFLIGLFPVANLNFSTSSFQFYSCLGIMEEVVCRTKFKISLFQEMGGFWYALRSGMLSERGIIGSPSSVRNVSAIQKKKKKKKKKYKKKKRCSNLLALENAHSWSLLSPPSSPLGHVHCSLAHPAQRVVSFVSSSEKVASVECLDTYCQPNWRITCCCCFLKAPPQNANYFLWDLLCKQTSLFEFPMNFIRWKTFFSDSLMPRFSGPS